MKTPSRIGKVIAACDSKLPIIGQETMIGELEVGQTVLYNGVEFLVVHKRMFGELPLSVTVRETITERLITIPTEQMHLKVFVEY